MAEKDAVEALLFDVFGTVVDWRSSIIDDLGARPDRWLAGR
jgi:hypothetical protein